MMTRITCEEPPIERAETNRLEREEQEEQDLEKDLLEWNGHQPD